LRELTKQARVLMIVDEVQSGCGRAGTLFAYELSGVEPDIMTLGKGIGGGVPLAALLATRGSVVLRAGRPGRHVQRQSADDGSRFSVMAT
jgi:acetylornithine/N-succinyldiaminopimelate aminotransferase